ncbi:CdaR family protein [Anaerocolumna sp.]|uniref:CdaR family protein n=1 Tax=Anaerocolumna sp. TaxID=2041569 RepID=UPI0028AA562E|nr:CdaR family protein [Anaerocolumna sp.]
MGVNMKEKLTRNIGLKILSLALAFLIWVVILNVDDPAITKTIEDVPVTRINENSIISKDKIYDVVSGDTVDVKVKGKRSIIEKLGKEDFRAIADLSKLSITYAVPIDVSLPRYPEVEINQKVMTMEGILENRITEQFRVDVVEKGAVAQGYYISAKTARPNMIQVSGSESVIKKINEVVVEVNVTNRDESFKEKDIIPKVYDKNGSLMDSSKMTFNFEKVDVNVNLLNTKTVQLFVEIKGTPYYGYELVNFDFEPKQVVIAGKQEDLDKVPYISAVYNINNLRTDIEDEIDIKDYITENVILIDENQNAVINIDLERIESKEIGFNSNEIELRNVPYGTAAIVDNSSLVHVKISGTREELNKVSKGDIKPYIDLAGASIGTEVYNIQFDNSIKDKVDLTNPNVSVTLDYIN